jgi:hypothetical protein
MTRHHSLLTRRRWHSYCKAIGPQNRVRKHRGTLNGAQKNPFEIDDKIRIEEQFISSQAFHRTPGGHVWETTVGERFEPRNLESFDLVTQEYTGFTLQPFTHNRKNRFA